MSYEYSAKYVKQISRAVEQREDAYLKNEFENVHSADISLIMEGLNAEDCKYILELLDPEVGADVISDIEDDTRNNFLSLFSPEELSKYMDETDSDDAADILNDLPVKVREEVIANMTNQEKVLYIVDLLHYEEDCAGGLMAKELVKANINWNVSQCIDEVRRQAKEVDKVYTVYVVDDHDILLGRISMKKLLIASEDVNVSDLYQPEIAKVHSYQDEEEVAELMQHYDLEVIPVVNVQGRLLGRITIDDVVDVITEQAEKDQQAMSGISEDVEETDSLWAMARARLPWLIVGMSGGLLGANFLGGFEAELRLVPAMAFFIPLITATGGNVGIQSSTIVVQSLASGGFHGSLFNRYLRVLMVALLNGITLALLVYGFNLLFTDHNLAIVVSVALFSVIMIASFMGTITPIILDKLGINPALASGPFITTCNDLIGLGVYFSVAKVLLH
ncbi:magnesium transporter [Flammeovirga kamogawensis]|uniref:Magnesium transporter MgtE n=1 Tax=Flammeovirga kamogawensis TaxID=373891 RepID=A0ABX8GWC7_9BACT|nr:magnesium transporter [Flammeovirga kamogawensis]MBB6460544.1 magnesium transporter [Flammeovirga kamogawensis]QWG07906.1 magnesium transporter [Flammeovirga kamogawensis]TRX69712.1 magnesium transporter [Flammeovirga kamogawensis]